MTRKSTAACRAWLHTTHAPSLIWRVGGSLVFATTQLELVRQDPVLVDGLRGGCQAPNGNAEVTCGRDPHPNGWSCLSLGLQPRGTGIERPDDAERGGAAKAPGGGEAPAITDLPIGEYGGRIFSTRLGTTSGVVRNTRRIRTAS